MSHSYRSRRSGLVYPQRVCIDTGLRLSTRHFPDRHQTPGEMTHSSRSRRPGLVYSERVCIDTGLRLPTLCHYIYRWLFEGHDEMITFLSRVLPFGVLQEIFGKSVTVVGLTNDSQLRGVEQTEPGPKGGRGSNSFGRRYPCPFRSIALRGGKYPRLFGSTGSRSLLELVLREGGVTWGGCETPQGLYQAHSKSATHPSGPVHHPRLVDHSLKWMVFLHLGEPSEGYTLVLHSIRT